MTHVFVMTNKTTIEAAQVPAGEKRCFIIGKDTMLTGALVNEIMSGKEDAIFLEDDNVIALAFRLGRMSAEDTITIHTNDNRLDPVLQLIGQAQAPVHTKKPAKEKPAAEKPAKEKAVKEKTAKKESPQVQKQVEVTEAQPRRRGRPRKVVSDLPAEVKSELKQEKPKDEHKAPVQKDKEDKTPVKEETKKPASDSFDAINKPVEPVKPVETAETKKETSNTKRVWNEEPEIGLIYEVSEKQVYDILDENGYDPKYVDAVKKGILGTGSSFMLQTKVSLEIAGTFPDTDKDIARGIGEAVNDALNKG